MNHFLKKSSIFFTVLLAFSTALAFFLVEIQFHQIDNYRIDPKINKLIIGDSQASYGIDDKLLPDSRNLSQISEPLIFSFYKIQYLLKNNPGIDTIFLGVNYHTFSHYRTGSVYEPRVFTRYLFILPSETRFDLLCNSARNMDLMITVRELFSGMTRNYMKRHSLPFLGSYEILNTKTVISDKTINSRILTQFYTEGKENDFAESNILYFRKILDLCDSNHVKVIVLQMPLNTRYVSKVPSRFSREFSYITGAAAIPVIDFSGLDLTDNDYLPDGDHLSRSGAIKATRYLKTFLACTRTRQQL
jgi:hypothetical protein